MMDLKQVRCLLKQQAREIGSQKQLAMQLGVSQQYLSDVIKGRRMPNANMLKAMGLEFVPCYRAQGSLGKRTVLHRPVCATRQGCLSRSAHSAACPHFHCLNQDHG